MKITLDTIKIIVEDNKWYNAYSDELLLKNMLNSLLNKEMFNCDDIIIYNGRDETGIDITLKDDNDNYIHYTVYNWSDISGYSYNCHWEDWSGANQEDLTGIIVESDENDKRNVKSLKFAKDFTPFLVAFVWGVFWGKTHYERGYNKYIERQVKNNLK